VPAFTSRAWHLSARPGGEPQPTDFTVAAAELPGPGPGQVLVRNTWLSVDPHMRDRMNNEPSYIPPF